MGWPFRIHFPLPWPGGHVLGHWVHVARSTSVALGLLLTLVFADVLQVGDALPQTILRAQALPATSLVGSVWGDTALTQDMVHPAARGAWLALSVRFSGRYPNNIAGDPPRQCGGAVAVHSTRHALLVGDGCYMPPSITQISAPAPSSGAREQMQPHSIPHQPPPIPSPFLRLYSMLVLSLLAYVPQWICGNRQDYRMALRHGMAAGFLWSGMDHFLNTQTRYVPMIPAALAPYGVALVYGTGVTELAGALGFVVPLTVYAQLGMPNLRTWAGVGIALMLACLTVANVHVALQASRGHAFAFATWTYWLRLLFQPLFILWALYAAGIIGTRRAQTAARA